MGTSDNIKLSLIVLEILGVLKPRDCFSETFFQGCLRLEVGPLKQLLIRAPEALNLTLLRPFAQLIKLDCDVDLHQRGDGLKQAANADLDTRADVKDPSV